MTKRFPEREFFMRSQGQVRFIKLTSRVQLFAATAALFAALVWALSMAIMAWQHYSAESERVSLLQREARVATVEERMGEYSTEIDDVAADLKVRQDFIESMVETLPEDARQGETVSDSASEAQATVEKVGALFPEAAGLAEVEARQLLFVERLTRFADRRSARAKAAIRQFGLNPDAMLRSSDAQAAHAAMGGPLETLASAADGSLDPRFERLGLSLARMAALERSLDGIPQVAPAKVEMVSSSFGYRRDPFTGAAAMHSGLDFRGPTGAPIYAAAAGKVRFAGRKSGYGITVEIDHGNGLMTRYAHMSRPGATLGQRVPAGAVIGAIGSTGRSTGPHLHFEVRVDGRAVNPRPFLEKAPHVLEKARSAPLSGKAGNQVHGAR
ncbi:MAG: M23 family metallopeptidase [Parerythrobacter sp.]